MPMLAYLDSLCSALIARDLPEATRLLRHPHARALPRTVREEIRGILEGPDASLRAPIQTLRFYHQTSQLLLDEEDGAKGAPQLELGLGPSLERGEVSITIARACRLPKRTPRTGPPTPSGRSATEDEQDEDLEDGRERRAKAG